MKEPQFWQNLFATLLDHDQLSANLVVIFNTLVGLVLGCVVGYERTYHGRAAGMRTYGLVCMASAAITATAAFSSHWFGAALSVLPGGDATRVIQGVVTGIGFLGAGIIMKDGLNISGLTTSASIWASSAIGVLSGVGFYISAVVLALFSASCMTWISKLEQRLPQRPAIGITLRYRAGHMFDEDHLQQVLSRYGYNMAKGSIVVSTVEEGTEWRFVAIAHELRRGRPIPELVRAIEQIDAISGFQLSPARN